MITQDIYSNCSLLVLFLLSWTIICPCYWRNMKTAWMMIPYFETSRMILLMDFLLYQHLGEHKIGNMKFPLSFHLFFSKILPYRLLVQIQLWLSVLNFLWKHSLLYFVDLQELQRHLSIHQLRFPIRFVSRALSNTWEYSASLVNLSFGRSSRPKIN